MAATILWFSCTACKPGANPMILSYNARAVKIYNTTSSLQRFENQKNAPSNCNAGFVVVNSKVVGLAPVIRHNCNLIDDDC
jgi:hypothetical protein